MVITTSNEVYSFTNGRRPYDQCYVYCSEISLLLKKTWNLERQTRCKSEMNCWSVVCAGSWTSVNNSSSPSNTLHQSQRFSPVVMVTQPLQQCRHQSLIFVMSMVITIHSAPEDATIYVIKICLVASLTALDRNVKLKSRCYSTVAIQYTVPPPHYIEIVTLLFHLLICLLI